MEEMKQGTKEDYKTKKTKESKEGCKAENVQIIKTKTKRT
jgi:hypothetical protein